MKHTAPSRINSQPSDLPIARLDVQDLEASLPIREYLELNGCAVVVNRKPAMRETYRLIFGNEEFVKQTIAQLSRDTVYPFVILFLESKEMFPASFRGMRAKIAVISRQKLSTRDVSAIFAYFFTSEKDIFFLDNSVHPVIDEPHAVPQKPVKPGRRPRPFLLIGLMALPILWYVVCLVMVAFFQLAAVRSIKRADASGVSLATDFTRYWLDQGRRVLVLANFPMTMIGGGSVIGNQERALSAVGEIVSAQRYASALLSEGRRITPLLFTRNQEDGRSTATLATALDRVRISLDGLINALGFAEAQLRLISSSRQFPFTISFFRSILGRADEDVRKSLAYAEVLRHILSLYRIAGGFDGKKTYLIILQNSMELRPTGGFIGSVATVSVTDGVMETPVVEDVYVLDGQLKGHVDPPMPIKELLQQEHWYLRDSNWDPDFTVSGERAAWFYQKESGQTIDGVIAVSTPVLTDLLGATGPITLPDYNDRITKENFFGKSLFYTKADFFPGSTQKKDFLGSLGTSLIHRITSTAPDDMPALLRVVMQALSSGNIQFWFPDRQKQALIRDAGWAGDLFRDLPCELESPPCAAFPLALVESNMGVNKVNSSVKRSVKTRIDLDEDGTAEGSITVTYQNASADDSALSGGGVYLNYLRVYLPPDAQIASILLDGSEIPQKSFPPANFDLPYQDNAGLAFTVPPLTTRTVTIMYRRGAPLTFTDRKTSVALSVRKQPGVEDTTLDASIAYPEGWKTDEATESFANIREVRYNTTLNQTKTFLVTFRK